ncbi:hypothetical protein PM082_014739 [Marasmius tenuissimus]|nr:hypothetical protein PM082_014739 [Marasmius tenuissimus]
MMKLRILVLLYLFCGMQAFHFGQLPATITAFRPQTLSWFRDAGDGSAAEAMGLKLVRTNTYEFVTVHFDGTQSEGQLIFTATITGLLTVFEEEAEILTISGTTGLSPKPDLLTTQIRVVAPVGPVTETTPPQMSSAASPPVVTDSNTSSSNTSGSNTSTSNSSQAKIIGGSIGGGGFLIVLIVLFLFRRRRSKQARVRLQDPDAAVIDPFTPTTTVSNPPREWKELPSIPVSSRKAMEGYSRRVTEPTTGEQSTNPQQPHTDRDGGEIGVTSNLGDDNRYQAMQAQIQMLMQRMERIEAVEEAPPEYVSAYGSSR